MDINPVSKEDFNDVLQLIAEAAEKEILPLFSEEGQNNFSAAMPEDTHTAFSDPRFYAIKAVINDSIAGFAALRDGRYLTHLFVRHELQRQGIGRKLLDDLQTRLEGNSLSLRASINAAGFYRRLGFEETGPEATVKGIRYIPMALQLSH
ncbi:GNAT family N-acetyltransferase [Endozoicomonadaceae bacterium StTr2]